MIDWSDKQHDWVRDALRRHAESLNFELSENDKSAILIRVRSVGGFPVEGDTTCSPLLADNLSARRNDRPRAVICSLGPVKNLNRLAPEQQLRFATNGLTIVYGDNGSGKSGYCRISKKLCRSLTKDDLLGNVFEAGAKPPAEVVVRYLLDGSEEPVEVLWKDGDEPPNEISNITVFDSHNARLYTDRQNRIGFLPAELALLERSQETEVLIGCLSALAASRSNFARS